MKFGYLMVLFEEQSHLHGMLVWLSSHNMLLVSFLFFCSFLFIYFFCSFLLFPFSLCWIASLSGGQQQRVMWARMFFVLQRVPSGQPRYALLDEATAAISMDWFSRLYDAAKKRGITVVSIAHNVAVEKLHTRRLTLSSDGAWTLN